MDWLLLDEWRMYLCVLLVRRNIVWIESRVTGDRYLLHINYAHSITKVHIGGHMKVLNAILPRTTDGG